MASENRGIDGQSTGSTPSAKTLSTLSLGVS